MLNTQDIKKDFKIFDNNPSLVYLDSGATSLKPKSVVSKIVEYYENYPANIHRGIYKISEKATEEFEETRRVVAKFINARDEAEVIFTRNTTEAINLVTYSLGRKIIEEGDEIVTSIMEHHSNFIPWQVLSLELGATFKVIDINNNGQLKIQNSNVKTTSKNLKMENVITKRTKILALTYVSNMLGTINPLKEIIQVAKKINPHIIIVIDVAQAVPHMKVDVQDLGCDFVAFSAHKMLGPAGVGVLWGKKELLDEMFPFQMGGGMISEVKVNQTIFAESPIKFEAGTPSIADVIAFKEAIKYLKNIGLEQIREHEKELTSYALEKLQGEFKNNIQIYGPQDINNRGGIIAFNFGKYHPHDIAQILDEIDVCVRAGHHCTMPLHNRLGINASVRASFYIYNDKRDVDRFIDGLKNVENILRVK